MKTLPYATNRYGDAKHEQLVKDALDFYNLPYVEQPNGNNASPDFRVSVENIYFDIECKTGDTKPTYNGGLPKDLTIYILSSPKFGTTMFYGKDVVSTSKRTLFAALVAELKEVVKKYQAMPGWNDSIRGFDFYMRSMFTQSGKKDRTNYFTHKDRLQCEANVLLLKYHIKNNDE